MKINYLHKVPFLLYNIDMAKTFSFDIVSDFNLSEVHNAIDQAKREIAGRYDFKGTSANLEFSPDEKNGILTITGDSQYQLDSIVDIVRKKLAARDVSQKILDVSNDPTTSNLKMTWKIHLIKGLDQEKSKKITKLLREKLPKLKTNIQGEEIRVTSSNKDELQSAISILNEANFEFPIHFTNYR